MSIFSICGSEIPRFGTIFGTGLVIDFEQQASASRIVRIYWDTDQGGPLPPDRRVALSGLCHIFQSGKLIFPIDTGRATAAPIAASPISDTTLPATHSLARTANTMASFASGSMFSASVV